MPIYTYRCDDCDLLAEISKNVVDFSREEPCPACSKEMKRQVPQNTSFALKGEGWFRDGYGGGNK